jgi:putative serine protease PepD
MPGMPSLPLPEGASDQTTTLPLPGVTDEEGRPAGAGGMVPPTVRSGSGSKRRGRRPIGTIIVTAVIAAALAATGAGFVVHNVGSSSTGATSGASSFKQITSGKNTVSVPVSGSSAAAPDWTKVAAAVEPSVVAIQVSAQYSEAEGSGVIINAKDGYILTNNHVIEDADTISVILADGRILKGTVRGTDPSTDLAIVKLTDTPTDLSEAKLGDSDTVAVGDPVMAVGNPLGYSNTVTTGIVSAINRPVSTSSNGLSTDTAVTNMIQVDASINPGNSGGPLFNSKGEVVGLNSSIATLSSSSSDESGSIGLGFSIPVNLIKTIAPELIQNGSAQHAYLGVSLEDATATYDGKTVNGVKISGTVAGSPAEAAGLKTGDVVVGVNGQPTTSPASLMAWVRSFTVGQVVKLTVVRDGKAVDLNATLSAAAASGTTSSTAPNQDDEQRNQDQLQQYFNQLLQQYGYGNGSGSGSGQNGNGNSGNGQ